MFTYRPIIYCCKCAHYYPNNQSIEYLTHFTLNILMDIYHYKIVLSVCIHPYGWIVCSETYLKKRINLKEFWHTVTFDVASVWSSL